MNYTPCEYQARVSDRQDRKRLEKENLKRKALKRIEAAAPDLLAACKLAKTVLIGLNFKPCGMVMKQLKAAIDKAKTPQT